MLSVWFFVLVSFQLSTSSSLHILYRILSLCFGTSVFISISCFSWKLMLYIVSLVFYIMLDIKSLSLQIIGKYLLVSYNLLILGILREF